MALDESGRREGRKEGRKIGRKEKKGSLVRRGRWKRMIREWKCKLELNKVEVSEWWRGRWRCW